MEDSSKVGPNAKSQSAKKQSKIRPQKNKILTKQMTTLTTAEKETNTMKLDNPRQEKYKLFSDNYC